MSAPRSPRPNRLTWVGHATVALDLDGVRLLTDPVLRGRLLHLRRHGARPRRDVVHAPDVVLISHLHFDHLDVPSLRLLGRDTALIVPRGAGALLTKLRFGDVTELAVGEDLEVRGVRISAVPAEHDPTRRPGGPTAEPLGFVIDGSRRIYFPGDTSLFPEMEAIGAPGLDVALLPVWGWGPSLGPGHMDPHEAARAAALLRPAVAIPIHWGTLFPRGLAGVRARALVDPPRMFREEAARLAPAVRVQILAPGGALSLAGTAVPAAP